MCLGSVSYTHLDVYKRQASVDFSSTLCFGVVGVVSSSDLRGLDSVFCVTSYILLVVRYASIKKNVML